MRHAAKWAALVVVTGIFLAASAPAVFARDDGPVAAIAPQTGPQAQVQIDVPRRKSGGSKRDVFAPRSWTPPPAPAQASKPAPVPEFRGPPEPPPVPEAPPLTVAYLGQLDVEGEPTVYYLAQGERVFAVPVGGVIDGTYQLLPPEGKTLALWYLPLNVKQLLPLKLQP